MLPTSAVERILQPASPAFQEIVLELRNMIVSVAPGVTEAVHSRGFSYYVKERGGPVSAGVCQIGLHEDHVRLAFIHGAFLPDPRHLLEGDSQYKRFVLLTSYDRAPWDDLEDLIRASYRFDPRTLQFDRERKE
jgi:hypothetical protein